MLRYLLKSEYIALHVALGEMLWDHQSGALILRRPRCSSVLIPVLVLGHTCPACFRCFPASTHLIQVTIPSSSSAVEAGEHLKHTKQASPKSSAEQSYFTDLELCLSQLFSFSLPQNQKTLRRHTYPETKTPLVEIIGFLGR